MDRRAGRGVLGRSGESAALERYVAAGYRPVATNWRCRFGEIDLVLRRGRILVFTEVKTRRGPRYGAPHEAVTPAKQRRLRRLAQAFLSQGTFADAVIRFDVASVTPAPDGSLCVSVLEDAF